MSLFKWLDQQMIKFMNTEIKPKHGRLCDFGRICQEVIPGDVLLIEGNNRVSEVIKNLTRSPWTHSALYIGRLHSIENLKLQQRVQKFYKGKPSEQLIIESQLGSGTIVRPISHYKTDHIRICRPLGLSQQDAQTIVAYAIDHLGKKYNRRQIFDLARYLFAHPLIPGRWKSSLFIKKNPAHSNNEICSTLIAEAFSAIRYPILPVVAGEDGNIEFEEQNPNLIVPRDFDYSPYFSIIKYPFFHGKGHHFQNMPWKDAQATPEKEDAS